MDSPLARFGLEAEPGSPRFWEAVASIGTPIPVAGPGAGWTVLFLRRSTGPADVWFESWSEPVALTRWGDSDCWYAEIAMPPRLRVTYRFQDDAGGHADPWNPHGAGADRSIAATPDAQPQPHWPAVGPDDVLPIPETRIRWRSDRLGGRRTVRVHRPEGAGPHPLVLLLDGDDWMHLHPAVSAFASAVASGDMPAATLVFLPAGTDREAELAADPALWEGVRDELLPLLAENGVPVGGPLVVAGQSFGGLGALRAALEYPELVTRVACQSGSFWWSAAHRAEALDGPVGGDVAPRLRSADLSGLRVAFDVGEHETAMLPHCELVETLTAEAGATVRVSRSSSGHDRAGWRHALVRDVAWALG